MLCCKVVISDVHDNIVVDGSSFGLSILQSRWVLLVSRHGTHPLHLLSVQMQHSIKEDNLFMELLALYCDIS